jgi:hypothetical protein
LLTATKPIMPTFVLRETDAERAVSNLHLKKIFFVQKQNDRCVHKPEQKVGNHDILIEYHV